MSDSLYKKDIGSLNSLIEESLEIAKEYCNLSNPRRDEILQSNKDFYVISIWDGRVIRVNPIKFIPDEINEIGGAVWINCNQDKFALESLLLQLLDKIKLFFVTHSKNQDSNDILYWQLVKSS